MKFPPLTVRSLQSLARVIFGGAEKSHVAVLCQGIAAQKKMIANALVADAMLDCSKRAGMSRAVSATRALRDRHLYSIQKLDHAKTDSQGNVDLDNGHFLPQIELMPAPAHY